MGAGVTRIYWWRVIHTYIIIVLPATYVQFCQSFSDREGRERGRNHWRSNTHCDTHTHTFSLRIRHKCIAHFTKWCLHNMQPGFDLMAVCAYVCTAWLINIENPLLLYLATHTPKSARRHFYLFIFYIKGVCCLSHQQWMPVAALGLHSAHWHLSSFDWQNGAKRKESVGKFSLKEKSKLDENHIKKKKKKKNVLLAVERRSLMYWQDGQSPGGPWVGVRNLRPFDF